MKIYVGWIVNKVKDGYNTALTPRYNILKTLRSTFILEMLQLNELTKINQLIKCFFNSTCTEDHRII